MRLIANLLLTVSLAVGALAAATAYNVSLALPDDELIGLTLNADAGSVKAKGISTPGPSTRPIAKKGQTLTPELIERLRADHVKYVLVRQFDFWRWPYKWVFFVALLGLLVAAGLIRAASRREITTAGAAQDVEGPEKALHALRGMIEELQKRLPELPAGSAQLQAILSEVGEAQKTHMTAFVEARALLIARLGLAGFAELMDTYAAAERQINRAWSAAADGAYEEALHCLDLAGHLLDEALPKLSPGKSVFGSNPSER